MRMHKQKILKLKRDCKRPLVQGRMTLVLYDLLRGSSFFPRILQSQVATFKVSAVKSYLICAQQSISPHSCL